MASIKEKQKRADEILHDARVSCDSMRQKTQEECDRLRREAEEEAEKIRAEAQKEGHDEGFQAGHDEGMAKAEAECRQSILDANAKAEHTLATAKEECHAYVDQAENEIADLAMQVVGKILPQHFIDVPQVVLPVVREAIQKVKDQSEVIVHVAPDSYDMVLMARGEFQAMLSGNAMLEVKSDDSLGVGDVLIETPNGTVDARLATQMELIRQAVQEVMS